MLSMKRVVSLILALCLMASCAVAEGPSTATDIVVPTEAPTAAPTAVPTAEPTQAPTEAPTSTPVPVVTQKPWDEAACQHNTPDCEQAPDCDVPGCAHIVQDAHGLDIPACALGAWLLDAQDAMQIAPLSVRAKVIDLNMADATLYRSGTYRIKGGDKRRGATLTVAANRVVVLELEDATLDTLTAGKGSLIQFRLQSESALGTLDAAGENEIVFVKGGALTIKTVTVKKDDTKTTFEVKGGSIQASLTEKSGLTQYVFAAQDAQSVTVAGKAYEATPHEDGNVYLWLPGPDAGMKWISALEGTALAVSQAADVAQSDAAIRPGEANALEANKTYELSGDVAENTLLTINENGVTVVLKDVKAQGTLIDAGGAYTLHITGENTVGSLSGSGRATLQGDGKLTVTGTLPAGYAAVPVDYEMKNQAVTLDGAGIPMVLDASGALVLPVAPDGKTYAITADAQAVTVRTVAKGETAFTLSAANPTADAGSAKAFTVAGDGSAVAGSIKASGATASAVFQNVRLQGDGALLTLTNEQLTVTLTGDNALRSASGKAIDLAAGSTLVLNVTSGRLALCGQNDLNGITLQGNILVEPESALPHTVLMIRDQSGSPVPNKELTVSAGGQSWQFTTFDDGSLHLWGLGDFSEIAATDGENVYTAVVMNGQAELTTGLTEFSDVTFSSQADGSLLISWAVPGAGTTGVQLLYGKTAVAMPDTYVAGAQHIAGKDFSARVTCIPAGSVVTVRVYATEAVGAVFSEETADGFQFGEVFTYVHRLPWKYEGEKGAADAPYTGKAYQNKVNVPDSATITYTGRDLVNGKPVVPGDYVMKVTIPEGDACYLPGTVEIPFTIKKLIVTIKPDYNLQKYRGCDDPVFTWTASGLLDGDIVTGELTRAPGEDVGEYQWLTGGFRAADYYEIRIDPDAMPFLVMPVVITGLLVNEVMHPVEQTIILQDGRKLSVVLTAQESLTVTHSVLGNLVRNEADEPRLFTPQLSWNPETDEVLLMMRAEPEMSPDHGYQTDSRGNPIWGVRRIRVTGAGLEHMDRMGITALTLNNNGASITCRIEDFLTEEIAQLIEDAGGKLSSTVFWMTVEPVKDIPEGIRPVTDGWRMSAVMAVGGKETDVTELMPNLTAAVDMEPVAELMAKMDRYDEELFPGQFVLSLGDGTALESVFVEPFEETELEKAAFPTMMYIDRYVLAPLTASGTVYAVNAPAAVENVTASVE